MSAFRGKADFVEPYVRKSATMPHVEQDIRNLGPLVVAETSMAGSQSGYFIFAHYWIHEDEVHRQCRRSMNILDRLPVVVRNAVHESDFYTEPEMARLLVKRCGPKSQRD